MILSAKALLIGALAAFGLRAAPVEIEGLEPTVLFPKQTPLQQIALLRVYNGSGQSVHGRITVRLDGHGQTETSAELPPGASQQRVMVPDTESPARVNVLIAAEGKTLAQYTRDWQPQRHWKVYIVKSSHEDLGYEGYIFEKQHDIADYIDLAKELRGGFHYTMESMLFMRNYIEERSESAWRQIVEEQIKPGRMSLMGAPVGVHSHWMDYEELARMTYPARREAKDRYGLDLKTFMIVDNPSLSWSGCQAVADAGFRYVARWGQGWRTGGSNDYRTTKLPALFWWTAPDGKHRVLFGWRSHYGIGFWYGQPGGGYSNLVDLGSENVNRELKAIESGSKLGPYPYDAVVNPDYTDHAIPHFDQRVLPLWAERYRYPEIHVASPTEFFEYVEKKYGAELPVLSGDLNNFSADYATIDPESQGWKRAAARLLPLAEGMGAVAATMNQAFLPPAALIRRTFQRLFDYDEHSWPTLPRSSDVQLFNAQWVKKNEAARAVAAAREALDSGFTELIRNLPASSGPALIVFNPLAHARTDVAHVTGSFPSLLDPDTGQLVLTETAGGQTTFVAAKVPAFGYKVYMASSTAASSAPLEASQDSIANEFYRIRFDRVTGAVASIQDLELKRELIDTAAANRFNELIFIRTKSRESKDGETYSPPRAKSMRAHTGAVRAEFIVAIDDPETGAAITQTVTLYRGLKRIDIVNELKHARALFSSNYEDRYRDNLYYAFPVKVEDFEARAEYPGGVVRPYTDQLRWGSHDYLSANRWVDVSNRDFGVTLAPWNAGIFNFGEIRYNQFSIDYRPASSHLYSYFYSNRMSELLALNGDDFNATVGYSVTSHRGGWNSGAATSFGWSVASPLEARVLPKAGGARASFLSIDAPNVQLTTFKQSEQPGRGWIARLVETEGKQSSVVVDLSYFGVTAAVECNLVEDDTEPLTVRNGKVTASILPFGFLTIRGYHGGASPPAVESLAAEAVSDKSVRVRWKPGGAAAYNVYRSEDASDPATAYTLAGRSTAAEFVDDWLNPGATYHYQVAAVDRHNNQGPLSAKARVSTQRQNISPPSQVRELGVVRRAKDRLILYWRTNPEPDVARYYVYRGDQLIAVVQPQRYFLQIYADNGLSPGTTYYYKVVAEDWAGNRQTESPVAAGTTPAY